MLLDTTFVIDLQREALRGKPAAAHRFLAEHPDLLMRISVITYGELAEGFLLTSRGVFLELVRPYEIVALADDVAWRYGELSRLLRSEGRRIGDNDLWIAATAMVLGAPLVTRDGAHFERISGLTVLAY